ncbi:phage tail protein [Aeromonas jandaei]
MSNFGAILTTAGAAKLANAIALGVPLKLTQMGVGDGNGQPVAPDPAMTAIPGEKRRAAINTLFADPLAASQLVAEQIIPEDVGGWWIRCVGLYDDSNTLIAIANVPDTFKPLLTSGAGRTQIIRMVLIVSDTSAVELKIDPSVVLATRKYIDEMMKEHEESREHPDATQTLKGMARYASDKESQDGKSKSVAATPAGVAAYVSAAIGSRFLPSGAALPATNVGPIWHDDYGGWMQWQEFTQNGADYRGYASQGIGSLLLDTQPAPRQGYIKSGVQNLSRSTYAALRAWAMHNGRMVSPATWQAGQIVCADNADGTTFRVYDVRGEFLRAFDDARGADPSRPFGSWQNGTHITGDDGYNPAVQGIAILSEAGVDPADGASRSIFTVPSTATVTQNTYWGRVRPRNTALLAAIKY